MSVAPPGLAMPSSNVPARSPLRLLTICFAIVAANFVSFALLSSSARADVAAPRLVTDDRLRGDRRSAKPLITGADLPEMPPAPKQSAPSVVSRLKDALTRPIALPRPVNIAITLPTYLSARYGKGIASEGWDIVKGTAGLVVNTDVTLVKAFAGVSTGNFGAAGRAVTDSHVGQAVTTTVKGYTTSARGLAALATDNDQAFVNAMRESPALPGLIQAAVQAPHILNTVRSGTFEQRVDLVGDVYELSGRLTTQAAISAVPVGGASRAASLASRAARAGERLPKLTPNEVVIREYGPEYWKNLAVKIEQLRKSAPAQIPLRKRLISELAEETNIPHLAQENLDIKVGGCGTAGGNCQFTALNTVDVMGNGTLSSPLIYGRGTKFEGLFRPTDAVLRDRGWLSSTRWNQDLDGMKNFLTHELRDGQIGLVESWSDWAGHATGVVRLGDEIYVVNNQGWAPGPTLQTLAEWHQTWAAEATDPSSVHYHVFVTPLTVGEK